MYFSIVLEMKLSYVVGQGCRKLYGESLFIGVLLYAKKGNITHSNNRFAPDVQNLSFGYS